MGREGSRYGKGRITDQMVTFADLALVLAIGASVIENDDWLIYRQRYELDTLRHTSSSGGDQTREKPGRSFELVPASKRNAK